LDKIISCFPPPHNETGTFSADEILSFKFQRCGDDIVTNINGGAGRLLKSVENGKECGTMQVPW
jgi:hypothetical protein